MRSLSKLFSIQLKLWFAWRLWLPLCQVDGRAFWLGRDSETRQEAGKYDDETEDWSKLLAPVISCFITSFYTPQSLEIKDFELRACHSAAQDGRDNTESVSVWLTAFCFWDKYGKRIKCLSKDCGLRTSWSDREPLMLDEIECMYNFNFNSSVPQEVKSSG